MNRRRFMRKLRRQIINYAEDLVWPDVWDQVSEPIWQKVWYYVGEPTDRQVGRLLLIPIFEQIKEQA